MNIEINAYAIHTLSFVQYSPNNIRTAALKVTFILGNEEGNEFQPAMVGNRPLTDQIEIHGNDLIQFLSKSTGTTEDLLNFSYRDMDAYLKRFIIDKYELPYVRSANVPNLD